MSTPEEVAAELDRAAAQTLAAVQTATQQWTAELQAQVQRNASGRPGPNAPTGDYRRSINRRTERRAYGAYGQVGTNKPQGRRLEHGFRGVDSLGRRYNQPPYPHFGPALEAITPPYEAALAALADFTAGGGAAFNRGVGGAWGAGNRGNFS